MLPTMVAPLLLERWGGPCELAAIDSGGCGLRAGVNVPDSCTLAVMYGAALVVAVSPRFAIPGASFATTFTAS